MKLTRHLLLVIGTLAAGAAWSAGLFEREIVFSEAEIQAELAKAKPLRLNYGGMIAAALKTPPTITLDGPDGRARIAASLDLELQGNPPMRVDMVGSAGIRYDEQGKAFYLEKPVAESVSSPALASEAAPAIRQAVTRLMSSYFRSKPIYVLRADASPQEATARWLLKSVRIEPGRVVALLSTI